MNDLRTAIKTAVFSRVKDIAPLSGGCIGQVYRVRLSDGRTVVVKADDGPTPRLDIEGEMLQYLRAESDLPVPEVFFNSPQLLIMEFVPGESSFNAQAQEHAAALLAALHAVTAPAYGFQRDTLIGGLHQPNPWTDSWLDFFREHRLLAMAEQGVQTGRLPQTYISRLERFCGRMSEWLDEPAQPALLHGDVWTTNVLAQNGRITAFIDPAVYYGHPEIELAFTTLFGTFGEPFFRRYHEIRPIPDGFFEMRRDLYNLYPLLVHVRLFGGGYVRSVDNILRRVGC